MALLTLSNAHLAYGHVPLLDGTALSLEAGERVALIGRNGAGKSSLFALLSGKLHEDGGDFYIPTSWRMAEVAQNMPETEQGATAFVLEGDTLLAEVQRQLIEAEASDDGMAIAHAYSDLHDAGAHDAEARAQALILGLGFRASELDNPVNSFSGGWRMRLQLARALMCPSDLLLLDEPTNHLDLDALVWLEAWLKRYTGTMIVISHDREFLDAITNVTLQIQSGQLNRYGGNYSKFEELRAQQLELQAASFSKQQEKMAHLQKFIDRFKAKASKAKQAQSRVKALARMERLAPVLMESDFEIEFREPQSLPNPMLSFDSLDCGYGTTAIVKNFNRSVLAGQRIGILGANGQGKSTLVKTIAKALPTLAGTMTEGKGLVIGYFAQQELDVLSLDDGALMHMVRLARDVGPAAREQELRDFLGRFRFTGAMVTQPVGSLSGGEKARLVLAMLVWQRPNLLLLDEPTNHLDLTTREALSIALNEFEGTVMLVSHDRALLREVCDEFWLVARGQVQPFDGDLDDYQKWLLDVSRAAAKGQPLPDPPKAPVVDAPRLAPVPQAKAPPKAAPKPTPTTQASPEVRKNAKLAQVKHSESMRPLRVELQRIDDRMAKLSAEKLEVEALMERPASPAASADGYGALGRRLAHISAEVGTLEERWLALQSELEALQAGR